MGMLLLLLLPKGKDFRLLKRETSQKTMLQKRSQVFGLTLISGVSST